MAKPGSSRGADYMRGFTWGLKGEEVVMKNLNQQLEQITAKSMGGLIKAAAFIRRETEKTPPLTPVDLGNLRASWFVVSAERVASGMKKSAGAFKGRKATEIAANHNATIIEQTGNARDMSDKNKKFVIMGYSANYAGFVHEMIGATFHRPGSDYKWLERHIKSNTSKIVQIVKDNVQIKNVPTTNTDIE